MPRRSTASVDHSRRTAIDAALRHASVDGLEGLTIGRLADELDMSKSGLFGLFGSKQSLQLRTLDAALELFVDEVWRPVEDLAPGRTRLLGLCDRWLAFFEREVLPGGCFLTTATIEFDARPGPLRDAVARARAAWLALLEREVATAVGAGELPSSVDPADTAFELNALASGASTGYQLTGEKRVLEQARRVMAGILEAARPGPSPPT